MAAERPAPTGPATFDVPGVGLVTLAAGEPCPEPWLEHAPDSLRTASEPAERPARKAPTRPAEAAE